MTVLILIAVVSFVAVFILATVLAPHSNTRHHSRLIKRG